MEHPGEHPWNPGAEIVRSPCTGVRGLTRAIPGDTNGPFPGTHTGHSRAVRRSRAPASPPGAAAAPNLRRLRALLFHRSHSCSDQPGRAGRQCPFRPGRGPKKSGLKFPKFHPGAARLRQSRVQPRDLLGTAAGLWWGPGGAVTPLCHSSTAVGPRGQRCLPSPPISTSGRSRHKAQLAAHPGTAGLERSGLSPFPHLRGFADGKGRAQNPRHEQKQPGPSGEFVLRLND